MASDIDQAVRFHQAGDLRGAVAIYRQILASQPGHADALHLLGLALHQQGDHAAAIELISRAIGLHPTASAFHANLGEVYRSLGQLDRALSCLQTAVRLDPISADARANLGLTLAGQGRLDEAITSYEQALRLAPHFAVALNNLGNAYRLKGDRQQALSFFRQAVEAGPDFAQAHSNLGQLLLEMDYTEEALAHCREAVRLRPQMPEALNNLGNVLRELGQLEEAKQCYREALQLAPAIGMTYNNMAQALQEEGRLDDAHRWYAEALLRDPTAARIHCNLASSYEDEENFAEAEARYRLALQFDPASTEAHAGIAGIHHEEGRLYDAITSLHEAIRQRPYFAAAHSALGTVLEELGQLEEAETAYRTAIQNSPRHAAAFGQLATLRKKNLPDADIAAMEKLLVDLTDSPPRCTALHYGMAQVYDSRGEYGRAAEHLRQANALRLAAWQKKGQGYSADEHVQFVERLISIFTPDYFSARCDFGSKTERPIFIVGLPRSGTTLTEQILASHSQVFGAGELRLVRTAFDSLPQLLHRSDTPIECLPHLDQSAAVHLAGQYLEGLRQLNEDAPRVADKMPDNYLHLGLLAILFPRAKFIHTRRDLHDVAVSCWMTNFKSIRWACDQQHIASRFRAYQRLMQHWQTVLPIQLFEVDYEQTVRDLESVARRLIDWCGLSWEPACLAFHETSRPVRTASVTQVRQPIYTRSLDRWRNYEQDLAQLFARLTPDS